MEPITTLIISSAVGGAAGGFVKELASNGVTWLVDLVSAHSPEVQRQAKQNTERFLDRLANRVERLEKELPTEKERVFQDALSHPGSAMLISDAMRGAATTDSDDRHELLAELIAQRLSSGADDMIALAGQSACGLVNCLSTRQIRLLAVMVTLHSVRPMTKLKLATEEEAKTFAKNWWKGSLIPLMDDFDFKSITQIDLDHLNALGCLRISVGTKNLMTLLSHGITENTIRFVESDLGDTKWFEVLKGKFGEGIDHCSLTSTGSLIGILRRDAKLGTKTTINW